MLRYAKTLFSLLSIFKDLERGAARVKAFVDLYFILDTLGGQLDWHAFFAARKRDGTLAVSVAVLSLLFDLLDCRGRFAPLVAAVDHEAQGLGIRPAPDARLLFAPAPGALRNKLWAFPLYECSLARAWLWWALSLPFRVAVYHPGKYARLKRTLRQWTGRWWTSLRGRPSRA